MKCSECIEYSKEEHICRKCRQGSKSAVKFWLRHESDCIDMEIKDGDCLYYSKVEKDKVMHELKTLPQYFEAVKTGVKTFELRKDDRNFKNGDILILREWEMGSTDSTGGEKVVIKEQGYTGREVMKTISYILKGGQYGLAKGHVILALS